MRLGEIANVSIGVLVNREEKKEGKNTYELFNLKSYENKEMYSTIKTERSFSDKVTQEGDLLFRLVAPNKVIYIDKEQTNLLVPSQLCIIRPNKEMINSIFLKWYLESSLGKEKITLELTGSSIQKISVNALKKIDIPFIEIKKQNALKDFITIWEKEKQVLNEMIQTKEQLYTTIIEELIEEE